MRATLAAFTDLENQREHSNNQLTALARQASDQGGDPALLDRLPTLPDILPALPNRIKQQLFDAFDLTMLYNKPQNQITCRATITPTTPATLASIITASEPPTSPPSSQTTQVFRI